MKKKQGLLVILLGCLVTVTAIAGVLVWQGTDRKEEDGTHQYMELTDPSQELLWNDEETKGTEEETAEAGEHTQTEETDNAQAGSDGSAGQNSEEPSSEEAEQMELPSEAPAAADQVQSVSFSEAGRLIWPIEGNVIMEYSMDHTVYFPTLEEYKCSPAVLIQGAAGTEVRAAADGIVKVVGSNEELGNYITLDLGNSYEVTCGQLNEITLNPGDYVESGAVIGTLAEPTKYYVVEGANLYFQMTKDGAPIDPLDYTDYAQE